MPVGFAKATDISMEMKSIENLTSTEDVKEKKPPFPGSGIICAIISMLFYCGIAAMVKVLDLHPTQISFSRCCIQFLIMLPIVQRKCKIVDILGPEGLRLLLWLRSIIGSLAGIFLYLTISRLSVGNAIAIHYLSMIMVPFAAWAFLKEKATILDIIFAMISLAGVVLIARPTFLFPDQDGEEKSSLIGVLFGLLSAVFLAVTICILRKIGPGTYPPLVVLYYSLCGILISMTILFACEEFQFPCWHELPLLLMIGCLGLLSQLFLTLALKYEQASTVSILGSTEIIFVYIVQVVILRDIPSVSSLIGASLIMSCTIGIGIRKLITERKKRRAVVE